MNNICGVLAMQGGYAKHRESLAHCGAPSLEVRSLADLQCCERLILPGGESTTMYRLLASAGLWRPLLERVKAGMPMFGTCAGMILLARHVVGVGAGQPCLGAIDLEVQRNAYGRQVASFSAELDMSQQVPENPQFYDFLQSSGRKSVVLPLVFIRAPLVISWGTGVQVLLRLPLPSQNVNNANITESGQAVCLQQGKILVCSFHPELGFEPSPKPVSSSDSISLLHQYFLGL